MLSLLSNPLIRAFATILILAVIPAKGWAGWVIFKNDTDQVIVIQETTVCNGNMKRGKSVRLMPGETMREFQLAPVARRVEVFKGSSPDPVFRGILDCAGDQPTYSFTTDGKSLTLTPKARPMPTSGEPHVRR